MAILSWQGLLLGDQRDKYIEKFNSHQK